jgi:hypothetical protein
MEAYLQLRPARLAYPQWILEWGLSLQSSCSGCRADHPAARGAGLHRAVAVAASACGGAAGRVAGSLPAKPFPPPHRSSAAGQRIPTCAHFAASLLQTFLSPRDAPQPPGFSKPGFRPRHSGCWLPSAPANDASSRPSRRTWQLWPAAPENADAGAAWHFLFRRNSTPAATASMRGRIDPSIRWEVFERTAASPACQAYFYTDTDELSRTSTTV